jgi:hypothetical protein
MSLVPVFELGLWNAWIFMVSALLVTLLCLLVMMKKGAPGGPARVPCKSKMTLVVATLSKFIYFPSAIYSVFLPLQVRTIWFYVGLPITLVGLVGSARIGSHTLKHMPRHVLGASMHSGMP